MNKKATDKIISVYWFAILFIVAAAIVYMVFVFYGEPYDVRELEANALTNHVADCLVLDTGFLKEEFLNEESGENFLEECNLNFNTEDVYKWNEQGQYYLNIEFIKEESLVFDISEGNKNLISSCGIEKEIEDENLAKCIEREFYSLTSGGDIYSIKILSIVRKTEKNA
ncbi:MAG TPA: hypothetical protein ENI22_00955 [Candidatus Pacearchaeota archaeon]|nr:hypothetical protein [Candidatus Pacearchaeota archaeon]